VSTDNSYRRQPVDLILCEFDALNHVVYHSGFHAGIRKVSFGRKWPMGDRIFLRAELLRSALGLYEHACPLHND
jgi:hypothetical protein